MGVVAASPEAALVDKPGGIFVRRGELIAAEDRTLLQTVARLVLLDEAGTLAELARRIDVPAEALAATVAAFNRACAPGDYRPLQLDHVATRGLAPAKSHWALPLDEAPYHAYPIISANVFTFGGLKVDPKARVLDRDGEPIAGLYAAGEIIGTYYGNYTGATSVLKGLVFGRIAGADAAAK